MSALAKTLDIRSSPHIGAPASVDKIMLNVVLALSPVCLFAVFRFGWAGLLVITTSVAACVLTEHVLCRLNRKATTINDWSVVITGLLLGLVLPPSLPLWMVAVGGVLGVGIGKFLFGGLGYNPFNPALVGRALLQAAFPAAMTTWPNIRGASFSTLPSSTLSLPLTKPTYDGLSGATPLADWKFNQAYTNTGDLLLGLTGGSTGETCTLLILLGGLYLIATRTMSWHTPLATLTTVACLSGALHLYDATRYPSPQFMLFSGGLMLGAMFMATDMVASPITAQGRWLYGTLIGLLVVVIRIWGGMPEGVMYAILIGNAASPQIDRWIQPRVFGTTARGRAT